MSELKECPDEQQAGDPLSVAFHEAGHAVAAVVLRVGFRYVTVRPRGGDCVGSLSLITPIERWRLPLAATMLAGMAADMHRAPDDGDYRESARISMLGGHKDLLGFFELAETVGSNSAQVDDCYVDAYRVAFEVIENNWGAVESVARKLVTTGTLSARDVKAMVTTGTLSARDLKAMVGFRTSLRECHYCPDGLLLCPEHYQQRYGHPHAFGQTFRARCAWCEEAEQVGNAATAAYELDADLPDEEDL